MKRIRVVAIIGKAGAGKDYVLHQLFAQNSRLAKNHWHEIISCTSRPIRDNEKDGINYHFLTKDNFLKQIDQNEFIEHSYFNNWYYGTRFCDLKEDKVNIGVFNPDGIFSLKSNPNIDLMIIWVHASGKTRLLRQLNREEHPDVNEIIRRYQADQEDFEDVARADWPEIMDMDNDSKYTSVFIHNIKLITQAITYGRF